MAGVFGEINQNLMGLQALAAGRQEIEQNRKQIEDQRIASESLREYQRTAQEGNPNFEALSEAALRSPQLASNFLQSVGIADARRGQDAANYALSAYQNIDNPDEFVRLTQNRINYLQQQGRDPSESVKVLEAYLSGDKENVRKGTKVLAASLANQGYLDKDIYASTFGSPASGLTPYQQERLNLERQRLAQGATGTANQKDWETYQRLLKEEPQAAENFGRAAGFASKEGVSLSAYAEKQLDLASTESAKASADASRYETLADQISQSAMSGGLASKWGEFIKEQTGNQNEITDLRKQVLQVVNSEAIKNLPPGVATDRDIELARAPFPTEKADPKYVADWLRAISNLNKKRAEFSEFKADFISRNGSLRDSKGTSLIKAWKEQQGAMQQQSQGASQPQQPAATGTVNWNDLP
jgi:ribosomal protein S16